MDEVGADWFSVPINATDDFQNFVQYVSNAWTEHPKLPGQWQRPISAPDFRQELLVHLGTLNNPEIKGPFLVAVGEAKFDDKYQRVNHL